MPLPINPAILIDTTDEKLHIPGSLLQPWFDSGEIKALVDLLGKYTTDVVDVKIDAATTGGTTTGPFDYIDFNTSAAVAGAVGRLAWNSEDGTLDLGVEGGNVTLQVGQEQLIRVVNKTGADLLEANYQCVKLSGAQGQRPKIDLAQANNDANSADTIGLVTETILNNQEGFVTNSGMVRNINTTGSLQGETWIDGNVLYLSGTVAGRITNVKPAANTHSNCRLCCPCPPNTRQNSC
jgi:hypothetical protein